MGSPFGLYRKVLLYRLRRSENENKKLRARIKELEHSFPWLQERERQLAELERLLVARSQHYDPQNPRVRRKVIRLRNTMLERQDG